MRTLIYISLIAAAAYAVYWVMTNIGSQYDKQKEAAGELGELQGDRATRWGNQIDGLNLAIL